VYEDSRDARDAIRDYDGANAAGQPIRITLVQPTAGRAARNPFDTAERPSRSLFDRIDNSDRRRRGGDSEDDVGPRRSNVGRPPPENVDRYVPGESGRGGGRNSSQRRSPRRDGRGGRGPRGPRGGRVPGERRQPREQSDGEGRPLVGGRPRKTAEELDAEMADYWGGGAGNGSATAAPVAEQDMEVDDI
jgi:THO complex subunit 4